MVDRPGISASPGGRDGRCSVARARAPLRRTAWLVPLLAALLWPTAGRGAPPPQASVGTAVAGGAAALGKAMTAIPVVLSAVLNGLLYSRTAAEAAPGTGDGQACPLGGIARSTCTSDGSFDFVVTLDDCGVAAPEGSLRHAGQFSLRGPGECTDNPLFGEVEVTTDLTGTFLSPGEVPELITRARLSGTATPKFSAGVCFLRSLTLVLNGTLDADLADGGSVSLTFHDTSIVTSVSLFNENCIPLSYSLRLRGRATLAQSGRDDRLDLSFDNFIVAVDASGPDPVLNMNGKAGSICFGGGADLSTLEPVLTVHPDLCPVGGAVLGRSSAPPAFAIYGSGGAVDVDDGNDGGIDASFATCTEPALLFCAACGGDPPDSAALVGAIFGGPQGLCDLTLDDRVSASDLVRLRLAGPTPSPTPSQRATPTEAASATGTPSETPSPTPSAEESPTPTETPAEVPTESPGPLASPSATATSTSTDTASITPTSSPTATPRPCPPTGARLQLEIDNRTGVSPVVVAADGERLEEDCAAGPLPTAYAEEWTCTGDGVSVCGEITLAPGAWRHALHLIEPATGQQQYRTSLVLAGVAPARLRFTAYAGVFDVDTVEDTAPGALRTALQMAPTLPKPLLIQFDPEIFPPGVRTAILLSSKLPALASDEVTIDGIDPAGAAGNRVVDAAGLPIAALSITGGGNQLLGLRLRNSGANNRDVLSLSGPLAVGNVIERVIVENAASADGIGVDQEAGADFDASANVIRDCEVTGAADKGIKVTTGAHARIERTWVHDNVNGGVQATLGGHIEVESSLVERNRGGSAQNGIVANDTDSNVEPTDVSEVITRGNISRGNGANGLAVRQAARGEIHQDYLAGNATSGLRVYNDVGGPASASVEGIAAVCNGSHGGAVADRSTADFGGGAADSPGNNAFAWNGLSGSGYNFYNATGTLISAVDNLWEHCGFAPSCDDDAIARLDLSAPALTAFQPSRPLADARGPTLTELAPSAGRRGDLMRIFGSGFEAIYAGASADVCSDPSAWNRCEPLRGNCVRVGGVEAVVEAATPSMLAVRLPFTCVEPVLVEVVTEAAPSSPANISVCTNP